ncbi:TBC domain-containing protein [Toxoplasma gondii TgCatPRC2]|uniref:TBC domain-containing protein n=1 Tax=Toxoplasma gondii TgCatPRC2 TaxID=1130821 RepID=A0A151HIH7_TOXGO|nr:TBC domain-containing protein [Toxoplasma gondii TgCatPRC2]
MAAVESSDLQTVKGPGEEEGQTEDRERGKEEGKVSPNQGRDAREYADETVSSAPREQDGEVEAAQSKTEERKILGDVRENRKCREAVDEWPGRQEFGDDVEDAEKEDGGAKGKRQDGPTRRNMQAGNSENSQDAAVAIAAVTSPILGSGPPGSGVCTPQIQVGEGTECKDGEAFRDGQRRAEAEAPTAEAGAAGSTGLSDVHTGDKVAVHEDMRDLRQHPRAFLSGVSTPVERGERQAADAGGIFETRGEASVRKVSSQVSSLASADAACLLASSSSPSATSLPGLFSPESCAAPPDSASGEDVSQVVERLRREKAEATEIFAETVSRYDEEIRFLRAQLAACGTTKAESSFPRQRSVSSFSFVFSPFYSSTLSSVRERGDKVQESSFHPGHPSHFRRGQEKSTSLSSPPSSCALPSVSAGSFSSLEETSVSSFSSSTPASARAQALADNRAFLSTERGKDCRGSFSRLSDVLPEKPVLSPMYQGAAVKSEGKEAGGTGGLAPAVHASSGNTEKNRFFPSSIRTSGSKSGIAAFAKSPRQGQQNVVSGASAWREEGAAVAALRCTDTTGVRGPEEGGSAGAVGGASASSLDRQGDREGAALRLEASECAETAQSKRGKSSGEGSRGKEDSSPKASLQRVASRIAATSVAKKLYGMGRLASLHSSHAADLSKTPAPSPFSFFPGSFGLGAEKEDSPFRVGSANSCTPLFASRSGGKPFPDTTGGERGTALSTAAGVEESPAAGTVADGCLASSSESLEPAEAVGGRDGSETEVAEEGKKDRRVSLGAGLARFASCSVAALSDPQLGRSESASLSSSQTGEKAESGSSGVVRSWRALLFRDKSSHASSSSSSLSKGGCRGFGGGFSFKGREKREDAAFFSARESGQLSAPSSLRLRRGGRELRGGARRPEADASVLHAATWIDEILPDWDAQRHSPLFKQLLHAGVPAEVRGEVWKKAVGDQLCITPRLYELLLSRVQHVRSYLLRTSSRYRDRIAETMRTDDDGDAEERSAAGEKEQDVEKAEGEKEEEKKAKPESVQGQLEADLHSRQGCCACCRHQRKPRLHEKGGAESPRRLPTRTDGDTSLSPEEAFSGTSNSVPFSASGEKRSRGFVSPRCCCCCISCGSCEHAPSRPASPSSASGASFASCPCGFFNWEPDVFSAFQTIAMDLHRTLPRLGACKARASRPPREAKKREERRVDAGDKESRERATDAAPTQTESGERTEQAEKVEEPAAEGEGEGEKAESEERAKTSVRDAEGGEKRTRAARVARDEEEEGKDRREVAAEGHEMWFAGEDENEVGEMKERKATVWNAKDRVSRGDSQEPGKRSTDTLRRDSSPSTPKSDGDCNVPSSSASSYSSSRSRSKSRERVDKQAVQPLPFGVPASHMMYEYLRCVLEAYAVFRPDVGYVQGMAYLAGAFLLYMDEYSAFVCLSNLLLRKSLHAFYTFDMAVVGLYFRTFDALLVQKLPQIAAHFEACGVRSDVFLIEWMYTLFTRCLPFELVSRVWDFFLVEGDIVLFQASLAILSYFHDELLGGSMDECMAVLSSSTTTHFQAMELDRFFACFHALALTQEHLQATMQTVAAALSRQRHQKQSSRVAPLPSKSSFNSSHLSSPNSTDASSCLSSSSSSFPSSSSSSCASSSSSSCASSSSSSCLSSSFLSSTGVSGAGGLACMAFSPAEESEIQPRKDAREGSDGSEADAGEERKMDRENGEIEVQ